MTRRCFHCGKLTDAAGLTAVGDGEFCAACFQALLATDSAPTATYQVPPADLTSRSTEPEPTAARPARRSVKPRPADVHRCLVCERDIFGVPAVAFLGGQLCAECNGEMQRELADADRVEAEAVAAASVDSKASVPTPSEGALSVTQAKFTPGAETRWCDGCERPMPGPGSYRVIDGKRYCPACVPFFAGRAVPVQRAHSAAISAPQVGSATACECCDSALGPDATVLQGFKLCDACAASDRDLVLGIARARHRRKLRAIQSQLQSEEDL